MYLESVAYSVSTTTAHIGEPTAFNHASEKKLILNCKGRAEITYTKISSFFNSQILYDFFLMFMLLQGLIHLFFILTASLQAVLPAVLTTEVHGRF